MQPPPLTAIAHGEVSLYVCFKFNRPRLKFNYPAATPLRLARFNPSTCFASCAAVGSFRISHARSQRDANARLRNFDTKPPSSYCYEFRTDNRLESVANAHTAADLHVRPVS